MPGGAAAVIATNCVEVAACDRTCPLLPGLACPGPNYADPFVGRTGRFLLPSPERFRFLKRALAVRWWVPRSPYLAYLLIRVTRAFLFPSFSLLFLWLSVCSSDSIGLCRKAAGQTRGPGQRRSPRVSSSSWSYARRSRPSLLL